MTNPLSNSLGSVVFLLIALFIIYMSNTGKLSATMDIITAPPPTGITSGADVGNAARLPHTGGGLGIDKSGTFPNDVGPFNPFDPGVTVSPGADSGYSQYATLVEQLALLGVG